MGELLSENRNHFITATLFGNFTRLGPRVKLATHEEHTKSHTGGATLTTLSAAVTIINKSSKTRFAPKHWGHKYYHPAPLHQAKVRKYSPSPVTFP